MEGHFSHWYVEEFANVSSSQLLAARQESWPKLAKGVAVLFTRQFWHCRPSSNTLFPDEHSSLEEWQAVRLTETNFPFGQNSH